MRYQTHVWSSIAVYCLILLVTGVSPVEQFSVSQTLSTIFLILVLNKAPNWFDSKLSIDGATGVKLPRMRHPLSHNPFVVQLYFILLFSIGSVAEGLMGIEFYSMVVSIVMIVWDSHLLLDLFTIEGIPLGLRPAITQNPHKNYAFEDLSKKSGVFSLSKRSSESDDLNRGAILISTVIIVFYLINLFVELTTKGVVNL